LLTLSTCMDVLNSDTKVHCRGQGLVERDDDDDDDDDVGQRKLRTTPSDEVELDHVL
jgi:hypothetical protein